MYFRRQGFGVVSVFASSAIIATVAPVAAAQTSTVAGTIVDAASGQGVGGARVNVVEVTGRATTSDSLGRFRFDGLTVSRLTLRVTAVGYAPVDTIMGVSGSTLALRIAVPRIAQQLDSTFVVAKAPSMSASMRAFEARRASGIGRFIDESAMREQDGRRLAEVLVRKFGGLAQVRMGSGIHLASSRSPSGATGRAFDRPSIRNRCWVTVYVDGAKLADGSGALPGKQPDMPPTDFAGLEVHSFAAAEFYAGGASVPAQYNATGNNCGTLLLWTRER